MLSSKFENDHFKIVAQLQTLSMVLDFLNWNGRFIKSMYVYIYIYHIYICIDKYIYIHIYYKLICAYICWMDTQQNGTDIILYVYLVFMVSFLLQYLFFRINNDKYPSSKNEPNGLTRTPFQTGTSGFLMVPTVAFVLFVLLVFFVFLILFPEPVHTPLDTGIHHMMPGRNMASWEIPYQINIL